MAEQPPGEKTEQATDKRMKDVRKKGQLQKSQDMSTWFVVGAGALMIPGMISSANQAVTDQLKLIDRVMADPTVSTMLLVTAEGFKRIPMLVLPMMAVTFLAVILAANLMGRVTFKELKPKLDHLQPANGLKKVFGLMAAWNGIKALLKSTAIGLVLWYVIDATIGNMVTTGLLPVNAVLSRSWDAAKTLLQLAVGAGIVLSVVDILVVSKKNKKSTMMTKQEVKDEFKQSEGDPQAKAHRQAIHAELTRNGMLAAMKTADAVVVNPIHVAVALRYAPQEGITVPTVVAKGKGYIAEKLRDEAATHKVPMVENILLARTLEKEIAVGSPVPEKFFAEVAEVLAFVQRLRTRGTTRGIHKIDTSSHGVSSKENRAQ